MGKKREKDGRMEGEKVRRRQSIPKRTTKKRREKKNKN